MEVPVLPDAITKDQVEADLGRTLTDEEWARTQGLLRRAARELVLLVGPLSGHDEALVRDTLIDAIREEAENPGRLKSESDDSYSYARYDLPDGTPGRFWWPANLLDLFGVGRDLRGRLRVARVAVSPGMRGWL